MRHCYILPGLRNVVRMLRLVAEDFERVRDENDPENMRQYLEELQQTIEVFNDAPSRAREKNDNDFETFCANFLQKARECKLRIEKQLGLRN